MADRALCGAVGHFKRGVAGCWDLGAIHRHRDLIGINENDHVFGNRLPMSSTLKPPQGAALRADKGRFELCNACSLEGVQQNPCVRRIAGERVGPVEQFLPLGKLNRQRPARFVIDAGLTFALPVFAGSVKATSMLICQRVRQIVPDDQFAFRMFQHFVRLPLPAQLPSGVASPAAAWPSAVTRPCPWLPESSSHARLHQATAVGSAERQTPNRQATDQRLRPDHFEEFSGRAFITDEGVTGARARGQRSRLPPFSVMAAARLPSPHRLAA